jgi:hypothetical protein
MLVLCTDAAPRRRHTRMDGTPGRSLKRTTTSQGTIIICNWAPVQFSDHALKHMRYFTIVKHVCAGIKVFMLVLCTDAALTATAPQEDPGSNPMHVSFSSLRYRTICRQIYCGFPSHTWGYVVEMLCIV